MQVFSSEDNLLSILRDKETLILNCNNGEISFQEFLSKYDNFYMKFALDGHESDEEELDLLHRHKSKIKLHKNVWELIIAGGLCSEEDAVKEEFIKNGRFGNTEGLRRLKLIANEYFSL
jgi:hypothetical protein